MNKKIIFAKGKHALVIQGTKKEKKQACIEIRDWAVKNNITMPAILTYESILNFRHCNYILWNGMCLDACLRNFSVVGYTIHHTVDSFKKVFNVEESEPSINIQVGEQNIFSDKDMASFGKYLLSKERNENIRGDKREVYHADIENWKHKIKNTKQ